ncbi:MAG: ATP-binding protein [Ruminiclostridium sp.]|nr:ATP-binding protein [Ruminiclostridium sp.]
MSFDEKFYRTAENEINARRAGNERVLAANEREIKQKFPEIYALNRSLAGTTGKLFRLINEHKSKEEFEAAFAELEAENLRLQTQLRQSLVRMGYAPDYLDLHYSCSLCRDTGVYDGRRCECFMEAVKRAAAADLNRSSPLNLSDFSDFSLMYYDDKQITPMGATAREIMAENLDYCRNYAENFHLPCDGILMRGRTGLGKTHLSLSIAGVVINKGYSVIYGSAPDLFRKAEQEHFGREDGNTVPMLMDSDLLILDDIGAEFESKFYSSLFYNIINNRMNAAKPTIVSTNLEISELITRYGERTVSRLATMDELIFAGTDVRLQRRTGGIKN